MQLARDTVYVSVSPPRNGWPGIVSHLLGNDLNNPTLRDSIKEINNDLRQGKDSEEAFMKQERVLGKFTARMLGLDSKSGNMAEIYRATAKFLERRQEFRKNLRSALITPAVTLFVLFLAVLFYVGYIFPETAKLFVRFGISVFDNDIKSLVGFKHDSRQFVRGTGCCDFNGMMHGNIVSHRSFALLIKGLVDGSGNGHHIYSTTIIRGY